MPDDSVTTSALCDLESMRAMLEETFPPDQIKPRTVGGGLTVSYIPGEAVIRRLNDASGGQWDLRIKSITEKSIEVRDRNGNHLRTDTLVLAQVALTIPEMGTREHIGVQMVNERGGEDLIKGAITDALKKAATLFGVGLHLYEDDSPPPQRQQQRSNPARQGAATPNVPQRPGPAAQNQAQRRADGREPDQAAPSGEQASAAGTPEGAMGWNEFWPWARQNGLPDKAAVEQALGEPVGNRTPAQLHALLSTWGEGAKAASTRPPPQGTPKPQPDLSRNRAWIGGRGQNTITARQWTFLWDLADDKFGPQAGEILHALARMDYSVESIDQLTVANASALIDYLQASDADSIRHQAGVLPGAVSA
jgi:hypothetical protein